MKQLIVFILLSGIICWIMFAPIYKHALIVRQALLQQEVDYLLEIGANGNYGYIDHAMEEASRRRLAERGFNGTALEYEVQTTGSASGKGQTEPVMRGNSLHLVIRYPYEQLFVIDMLIGLQGPKSSAKMSASGMKMSEFVVN